MRKLFRKRSGFAFRSSELWTYIFAHDLMQGQTWLKSTLEFLYKNIFIVNKFNSFSYNIIVLSSKKTSSFKSLKKQSSSNQLLTTHLCNYNQCFYKILISLLNVYLGLIQIIYKLWGDDRCDLRVYHFFLFRLCNVCVQSVDTQRTRT